MLRWRNANKLCTWIEAATASDFRFLAQFANRLRRDLKAVELSITTPWSNGPIETGRAVGRDIVQAVVWYQEAAKLGDQTAKDALDRLGRSALARNRPRSSPLKVA
jgi:Cu2+-containing amine oxidase